MLKKEHISASYENNSRLARAARGERSGPLTGLSCLVSFFERRKPWLSTTELARGWCPHLWCPCWLGF
jgi:hypothetical protein